MHVGAMLYGFYRGHVSNRESPRKLEEPCSLMAKMMHVWSEVKDNIEPLKCIGAFVMVFGLENFPFSYQFSDFTT